MANYEPHCRSNYFGVKDRPAFDAWASNLGLEIWTPGARDPDPTSKIVAVAPLGDNGWPSSVWNDDEDDSVDIDFVDELRKHLAPDAVCILMEVGFEKLRYLVGVAQAFKAEGEIKTVSLGDIYAIASQAWPDATITEAQS